jgi:hypothetical protein
MAKVAAASTFLSVAEAAVTLPLGAAVAQVLRRRLDLTIPSEEMGLPNLLLRLLQLPQADLDHLAKTWPLPSQCLAVDLVTLLARRQLRMVLAVQAASVHQPVHQQLLAALAMLVDSVMQQHQQLLAALAMLVDLVMQQHQQLLAASAIQVGLVAVGLEMRLDLVPMPKEQMRHRVALAAFEKI